MSSILVVAPREIRDLVNRACRVGGCDAGLAGLVASNVAFGELHFGGGVEAFVVAMNRGEVASAPFVAAPMIVVATEVVARDRGEGRASFSPAVPLASIAGSIWTAAERGVVLAELPTGVTGLQPIDQMVLTLGRLSEDVLAAFEARETKAHRDGMVIGRMWFEALEQAAGRFLVDEATLDANE